MSLKVKLITLAILPFLVGIVPFIVFQQYSDVVEKAETKASLSREIHKVSDDLHSLVSTYSLYPKESRSYKLIIKKQKELSILVSEVLIRYGRGEHIDKLNHNVYEFKSMFNSLNLASTTRKKSYKDTYIISLIQEIGETSLLIENESYISVKKVQRLQKRKVFYFNIVSLIIFTILGIKLLFDISKSIKELQIAHKKLAEGDFDYIINETDSHTSGLARSLNEMTTKVIRLMQERSEQQQVIYQNTKMAQLGEMLANIVHQWKQPLNSLLLNTYLIEDLETKDNEEKEKIVESSRQYLQTMSDIAADFTSFYDPNTQETKFSIKESILKSNKIVAGPIHTEKVKIITDLKADMNIVGRENEFMQVIINLITNSIYAYKNIGRGVEREIRINSYNNDTSIQIEVNDKAGGIKDTDVPNIFKQNFTTKGGEGTGIGLYLSKDIIENKFKGTISYKKVENGSSFIITIPSKEG
jgi:signal transduction histidine kinase